MTDFDQRIKALRAEVEALKAAQRKNSTVLRTVTKAVTCTARLYRTSSNVVICRQAGLVEIDQANIDNEFVFGFAQPPFAYRSNRNIDIMGWVKDDGTPCVLCIPSSAGADNNMAANSYKDITITVEITATDDFTTTSGQILNDDRV